jgi:PAS domain S-box-containing protein
MPDAATNPALPRTQPESEAALRRSEERFRSVWEHSIDGMRLTDGEGRIIAVNEAFCALVRRPRENLMGHPFSVTYAGHGSHDGLAIYQQRFSSGNILPRVTARVKLWNAEELDLEISSSFIELGEHGKVLLSLFRDVTERTEAELRGAAFGSLGQGLSAAKTAREAAEVIFKVADQLLGWDACLFGLYSAEDDLLSYVLAMDIVNGRRVECSLGKNHQAPTRLARRAIEEGGQLVLRDQPDGMRPDGSPFGDEARPSASIMFVPMRNGTEIIGILSIQSYSANAYDRGSLETLQALADHCGGALDRIRTEAALGAVQEQLRQSQKMEAIGQLAGGVAHDFNNMLAVIRGNAELLQMDAGRHPERTGECLNQIIGAADRAGNLTRQLLAFSRKQIMQFQRLGLNDVIANLTKMLNRIIGEHIRLECHYAARLPLVRADAGMVEQVLVNLVVNARDAMPRGGQLCIVTEKVSLDEAHARANPESRAGEFVCLTVRDTGTGIAPEHLPRIFEPFFTTKELGKGTGLGLATVYGIVKQHQGWIEAASQAGAGSTFKVFLAAIAAPATEAEAPAAEVKLCGGTETILLVEDDEAVRRITRRVLENLGYKIYEASSAREALAVWDEHSAEIALLLSDVVMPDGISGRDLTDRLRQQRPSLKVILMSGYSPDMAGRETGFFQAPGTHFLQKPCPVRLLGETVRRCLDERRA